MIFNIFLKPVILRILSISKTSQLKLPKFHILNSYNVQKITAYRIYFDTFWFTKTDAWVIISKNGIWLMGYMQIITKTENY